LNARSRQESLNKFQGFFGRAMLFTITIRKPNGDTETIRVVPEFGEDKILEWNQGWRGDDHFWLDTPGLSMFRRSGNRADPNNYPVISASATWIFTFKAEHKPTGVTCKTESTMNLTVNDSVADWH
jgi:hypothetical protein